MTAINRMTPVAWGIRAARALLFVALPTALFSYSLWQANNSLDDRSDPSVEVIGTAAGIILTISFPALVAGLTATILIARRHCVAGFAVAAIGYVVIGVGAGLVLDRAPQWGYWPAIGLVVGLAGSLVELRALVASARTENRPREPGVLIP